MHNLIVFRVEHACSASMSSNQGLQESFMKCCHQFSGTVLASFIRDHRPAAVQETRRLLIPGLHAFSVFSAVLPVRACLINARLRYTKTARLQVYLSSKETEDAFSSNSEIPRTTL